MSALDLDAIQARADAATPGPWVSRTCEPCAARDRLDLTIWGHGDREMIANWSEQDEFYSGDAEFIAHARTDVPALVAEVRALRLAMTL